MSLKVNYVNGMPFVKYPFPLNVYIPECTCKIFNGKFGVSVGIFLNESPPSVMEKMKYYEFTFRRIAAREGSKIVDLLNDEGKLQEVKFIKNGMVWGKYDFLPFRNQKMKASLILQIEHIFFSMERVSISCKVLSLCKIQ